MPFYIPDEIIEEVRARTDIAEVISGYIPLKRAGKNFKALCPFHHEKTPSFMVNPEKQIVHCFGCSEGGNVFSFIMKYDHLEFPEAVRLLASKTGVDIPVSPREKGKVSLFQDILKVNLQAATYYHDLLMRSPEAQRARQYLKKRDINQDTAETFKLGFANVSWDGLLRYAKRSGIQEELLITAGLIIKGEKGFYDRFRDRIIYPIFDTLDRVVGFGGRSLMETATPKYMNSPETETYKKERQLYGLNISKEYIREADYALLVEGYMDLLSLHQAGVRNVVATCGTALTREQARLIRRYIEEVIILYDSDSAGEKATLRGLDLLIEEGLNVKIAVLPQGEDPDSFVRKNGKEKLLRLIARAKGLFDYKVGLLRSRYEIKTPEGKAKFVEELSPTILRLKNAVLRSEYLKRLAEELKISEDALMEEVRTLKRGLVREGAVAREKRPVADEIRPAEKFLIGLMLEEPRLIAKAREIVKPKDFLSPEMRRTVEILFTRDATGEVISASGIMCYLEDEATRAISEVLSYIPEIKEREKSFADSLMRIKEDNLKRQKKALEEKLRLAEDRGDKDELAALLVECNKLIKGS